LTATACSKTLAAIFDIAHASHVIRPAARAIAARDRARLSAGAARLKSRRQRDNHRIRVLIRRIWSVEGHIRVNALTLDSWKISAAWTVRVACRLEIPVLDLTIGRALGIVPESGKGQIRRNPSHVHRDLGAPREQSAVVDRVPRSHERIRLARRGQAVREQSWICRQRSELRQRLSGAAVDRQVRR